jgi:hypothetical protein
MRSNLRLLILILALLIVVYWALANDVRGPAFSNGLAAESFWRAGALCTVVGLAGLTKHILQADPCDACPPVECADKDADAVNPEGLA